MNGSECPVKKSVQFMIVVGTGIICWLALSYLFFPIKLSAPTDLYFKATMTRMIPLKAVITLVFVLLALFLYEQSMKKDENK